MLDAAVLSSIRRGRYVPSIDTLLTSLVGWWPLNEASGTRVNVHNPGTFNLTDNNTVAQTTGVVGNAASFLAANSESLSNASPPIDASLDWTVACWIRRDAVISCAYWAFGGTGETRLTSAANASLDLTGQSTDGAETCQSGIDPSTARHVICDYTASTKTFRIRVNDSTEVTNAISPGTPKAATAFYVGARSGGAYLTGFVDEIAVWQRLLTAGEKTQLYNSGAGMGYPG